METARIARNRSFHGSILLKKPVTCPFIFALLIGWTCLLNPVNLFAETPYPGPVLITSSSWEGEASSNGYGMQGGLSLEGFPVEHVSGTLNLAYRWINLNGTITPIPGIGFLAGYRFPLKGLVSFTPIAGPGIDFIIDNTRVKPTVNLGAAIRVSILLLGRDYLTMTPGCTLPFGILPPRFYFAIGIKKETPWIMPVPEVHPIMTAQPSLFSPDDDGIEDSTVFSITVDEVKSVKEWKLAILKANSSPASATSYGIPWREFSDVGIPPATIIWDGKSDSGEESDPGVDYRAVLEIRDILERTTMRETSVTVDILVIRDGNRFKVKVPDIRFPSYSYDLSTKESQSMLDENRAVLNRIATLFSRFPDYHMTIEGFANAEFWNDPKKREIEERDSLIPLSAKRAETVKQALVLLGIDAARIRTVGMGSARPLADYSDSTNNWKNRRVEFILSK